MNKAKKFFVVIVVIIFIALCFSCSSKSNNYENSGAAAPSGAVDANIGNTDNNVDKGLDIQGTESNEPDETETEVAREPDENEESGGGKESGENEENDSQESTEPEENNDGEELPESNVEEPVAPDDGETVPEEPGQTDGIDKEENGGNTGEPGNEIISGGGEETDDGKEQGNTGEDNNSGAAEENENTDTPASQEDTDEPSLELLLNREYDADEYWESATVIEFDFDRESNFYNTYCRAFICDGGLYFAYYSYDDNLRINLPNWNKDFVSLEFTIDGYKYNIYISANGIVASDDEDCFEIATDRCGTFDDFSDDYGWGVKVFFDNVPDELELTVKMSSNGSNEEKRINSATATVSAV